MRRCTGGLVCPCQRSSGCGISCRATPSTSRAWARSRSSCSTRRAGEGAGRIFTLEARDKRTSKKLTEREGYGETSVRNLFAAIEARREISLDRFIYALGIRHVGETNARLLARHYGTMEAFTTAA